jgi:hypothetical protein
MFLEAILICVYGAHVDYLGIASARMSFRLRGGSADISNDDKVFMDLWC